MKTKEVRTIVSDIQIVLVIQIILVIQIVSVIHRQRTDLKRQVYVQTEDQSKTLIN